MSEDKKQNTLTKDFKSGIGYTALGKVSMIISTLSINAVLSRLISPTEYGIVGVVTVFITFFQIFIDAGMGPAIIQNKDLSDDDIGVLFNVSIIFSAIVSILFGIFGYAIAFIYRSEVYIPVSWVLSIGVFSNGLMIVPDALLAKEKRFKELNIRFVVSNLVAGILGIICALMGMGIYALCVQIIATGIIGFCLMYPKVNIKLVRKVEWGPVKKIWSFASNQFSFNFINYFSRNADKLLIGKYMGNKSLGYYDKAYQLLMYPNTILLGIITPALQPILKDYQDDILVIRSTYLKIFRVLLTIGLPLSVFLSLSSNTIITFMFGNQWSNSVLPFAILSLTVWCQMTLSSTGAIYQARNMANKLFINGFISAVILVSSIIIGVIKGNLVSVSICLSIGFLINWVVTYLLFCKNVLENYPFISLLKELIKPALFSIVLFIILYYYNQTIIINNVFFDLTVRGLIFIILLGAYIFFSGEYKEIKKMLQ